MEIMNLFLKLSEQAHQSYSHVLTEQENILFNNITMYPTIIKCTQSEETGFLAHDSRVVQI